MRDVSMNPTTGRILEAYDNASGKQKAGIAAYGGKLGGVAKFFHFAVDVKIGDKTVTVNKKSLEKFMSRHGEEFHYKKESAEQLGSMIQKLAPKGWDRDTVIKQLARTEEFKTDDAVNGGISMKKEQVQRFLDTLEECGIEVPENMKKDLQKAKEKFVVIKKEFVDQLRESAKKIMTDEGIPEGKWVTDTKAKHVDNILRSGGAKEPVTEENLADKIKALHLPKDGSPLERCQRFFGNEGFKEIIDFAKTDKASARILMRELFGDNKTDSNTVKEGIAWVMKSHKDAYASLEKLIATAQGK